MRYRVTCRALCALVALASTRAVADIPAPTGARIVAPDSRLELVFSRQAPISGGLTEGPAAAPDGGIYFSDIPRADDRGMILRFDPRTNETSVFSRDSGKSNGLMFDLQGRLVACEGADNGGRRIARWDIASGRKETIVERIGGKRFNSPNDLWIDVRGRIWFTDPRYAGHEPRELEHRAVYRVDPDGAVVEVTHDVEKPNGIALSPDQRTLYVADTNNGTDAIDRAAPPPRQGAMKVWAFSLDADGAVAGQRRVVVDFGDEPGCDGMTLDIDGNLYLTARSPRRPGVLVVDSAGKELAFIPTAAPQPDAESPVGLPSNCVFGIGAESDRLYVTVDTSLYRIRLRTTGYNLARHALLERFRRELVAIRLGEGRFPKSFVQGRDGASPTEAPAHRVTLSQALSIGAYEVPQNLWEAVMGSNPSRWKGPRNSVENLSFDEALEFCREATRSMRAARLLDAGEVIRLPTESEWEYCARAGTSTVYSFGDDAAALGEYGWFAGNAAGNDPPVGAKKPNAWGLFDVHGYLWEWCVDSWHANYAGAPVDGAAWMGGERGTAVLRGGSWRDAAALLTSSARRRAERSLRGDEIGLRCVLAPSSGPEK